MHCSPQSIFANTNAFTPNEKRSFRGILSHDQQPVAVDTCWLLTKSNPKRLHVCCIIFVSHFSFGSGGGVPAIGCGRGLVILPPPPPPGFVVFADKRGNDADNALTPIEALAGMVVDVVPRVGIVAKMCR